MFSPRGWNCHRKVFSTQKCYIMATFMPDNYPIWHYYSHWTSRIIGRVEINDLEYPRGQKHFHPGDETVFGEGFLPWNATLLLHSCWIMNQYDISIAIEHLESLLGLYLMFWNIAGVKIVFTPGIKLYSMRIFYPKMLHYGYIHAG